MRVINQWKSIDGIWGISLLTVFKTEYYAGFVILGVLFEWQLKPFTDNKVVAQKISENLYEVDSGQPQIPYKLIDSYVRKRDEP